MSSQSAPEIPLGNAGDGENVAVQRPWRMGRAVSSTAGWLADRFEGFLGTASHDRGPWLAVAFAGGIGLWFWLDAPWQWIGAMAALALAAIAASALLEPGGTRANIRIAVIALSIMTLLGTATVWSRSEMIGAEPLDYPRVMRFEGRVLEREEQPSQDRVRLTLAMRDAATGTARKVRINVPLARDKPLAAEGAVLRLRARLMPPAPPMLPGSYDFARAAWFKGLAATATLVGDLEVVSAGQGGGQIARWQRQISGHVREQLGGSPGTIAAAFASGDRGGVTERDADAMRDAGLTHLLSISGLHVSAVIAAAYLLAIRLLALWPWLTLRVRLPVVAAGLAALAGVAYTLLTGAEVPTVRSCVAALLVLTALALGREPLSLRMVALAALFVLLLWPESLVGPSFQMSFSAVIAIVALHNSAPVRAFLLTRDESWFARMGRGTVMLLVTGFVIEIALMPIVMFHFHRAGLFGAFANVIAIPLVTFASMPLIAVALFLDVVGLGAPAWWVAGKSLEALLGIAHYTASLPGAVKLAPQIGLGTVMLYVGGALWLALWRGNARLYGLLPIATAAVMAAATPAPDMLISGDGRHVGIAGEGNQLILLRDSRSSYVLDNFTELAGVAGQPVAIADWPGASCSPDFCVVALERGGQTWQILLARSRDLVEERALAAACERSDIVVADRYLPQSCAPRWLKADRRLLEQTGGLAVDLDGARFDAVADTQGSHGWWKPDDR
ncbi:hypothetical protein HME9302_01224 [Alteripontixanthobacter maritimus]|uniref:ComE operon protein n=1 Tax=Alteripontixanthobacter maritimus TaxID=2161824 RepID=A0A369Q8Z7_9SPHN|nr:ComEC/Rec2 family competence protein [Alteripontixanthobacter maritimus]RDC60025.1 hypothetical protein HME9302_01224 [Alteripontixanthobacter maritimus]